ncbi:MAG: hypothetical protein SynsKO_39610 [Synoicihabitans sp.]
MSNPDDSAASTTQEYERERVPDKAQKGPGSFWGMYAGEHTAGTEFMIGPLFVAWGVGAMDLITGLLVGNLMAVLMWRFVTAEVAVRTRETLYFKLEKICGANLAVLYNLANGILFCFLAGSMITVSATAVGVPFPGIKMPTFADLYPTGAAWTVVCIIIGMIITAVAVRGYAFVARMSNLAAPWMFLIFVACGIVTLGKLNTTDVMALLEPAPDTERQIGFWGVVFFSWFCNAAMNIGMADMSVLRYAKKPSSGWAAAAGMYLGHYVAWVCAALLLMYWVRERGADPTVGVAPGPMVFDAVGWAGIVCVIIAGWTTANPTIYRAGLAFQGAVRSISRTKATILAGAVSTAAGIFPAFAMNLLGFVGIYGTILAPIGAIIFADVFLAPRMGLPSEPAKRAGIAFSWNVLIAWVVPVSIALYIHFTQGVPAHFLPLPSWIACGALYLVLTRVNNPVRTVQA